MVLPSVIPADEYAVTVRNSSLASDSLAQRYQLFNAPETTISPTPTPTTSPTPSTSASESSSSVTANMMDTLRQLFPALYR